MRAIFIIMSFFFAFFIISCGREKPAPPLPATVEVATAVKQNVRIQKDWVGVTDGIVDATIRAQVTGYLIRQNYKDGDFVKKGDLLFEIDPRPFLAALNQAQADLARQEALHVSAKVTLDRLRPLAAQNAVSKSDLDNAIGVERSAMAAVLASKAAVEQATLNLGFTKITSPIDGIAGFAQNQIGDLVGPAQPGQLTVVSQVNPIRMYISLSEEDYFYYMKYFRITDRRIKDSEKLESELILSGGVIYPHKGMFYALDRQVGLKTGTVQLALEFPNPDNLIRPGMFARARITEIIGGAIVVPQEAVTEFQGSSQVAVVGAGDRVEFRTVIAGEHVGDLRVIREGLKPGERVIVQGMQKVKQGTLVMPKPYVYRSPASANIPSPSESGTASERR